MFLTVWRTKPCRRYLISYLFLIPKIICLKQNDSKIPVRMRRSPAINAVFFRSGSCRPHRWHRVSEDVLPKGERYYVDSLKLLFHFDIWLQLPKFRSLQEQQHSTGEMVNVEKAKTTFKTKYIVFVFMQNSAEQIQRSWLNFVFDVQSLKDPELFYEFQETVFI